MKDKSPATERQEPFENRRGQHMRLRQLVITAEKTETYIFRQESPKVLHAHCEICTRQVSFLTVDQSVKVTGLGARTLFRLVEAEEIHCYETDEGLTLFCPNSVSRFIKL